MEQQNGPHIVVLARRLVEIHDRILMSPEIAVAANEQILGEIVGTSSRHFENRARTPFLWVAES